jgi:hypothetical protein
MAESSFRTRRHSALIIAAASIAALAFVTLGCRTKHNTSLAASHPKLVAQPDDAGSRAAFLAAYSVFMHARCMNCHPSGDVPLQGDDSHPHAQNVKRGPEGKGLYALKCANCHQYSNLPGLNMPPGNPNWHMLPPTMKMVFQGRTPAELARQLKDPKQNGGRSLEQLLHHVAEDKLVLGGWDPGDGRTKPPIGHAEFAAKMREWIEKGAAIPE